MSRLIVALVLLALMVAACDSPLPSLPPPTPGPTFDGRLSSFSNDELTFDYPAHWNAATFDTASTRFQVLVFLSTEPLRDPCIRHADSIQCGHPVSQLGVDGVLVRWAHWGFPGWVLKAENGQILTIDGRRATVLQVAASESCRAIGGEEELTVEVELPLADNFMEMTACVRGPSIDAIGDQIADMLKSVRWSGQSASERPF